jgi:aryl-alcohol dehydrogenase-like predicted oxidoreductase
VYCREAIETSPSRLALPYVDNYCFHRIDNLRIQKDHGSNGRAEESKQSHTIRSE